MFSLVYEMGDILFKFFIKQQDGQGQQSEGGGYSEGQTGAEHEGVDESIHGLFIPCIYGVIKGYNICECHSITSQSSATRS